jgi:hypothetical protein
VTRLDERLLAVERGAPVSSLGVTGDPAYRNAYQLGPCLYALTSTVTGRSADDPGVLAILWVRDERVLFLVLDAATVDLDERALSQTEEPDVIGFRPLTYGNALEHARARGETPMLQASYELRTGTFRHTKLNTRHRDYYFLQVNPAAEDLAVAVKFRLLKDGSARL